MDVHVYVFVGQGGGDGEAIHPSSVSRLGSRNDEAVDERAASVEDSPVRRSESKIKAMLRDEVLINAQKFKTQV